MSVSRVRSVARLLLASWCVVAAASHALAQVATGTITGVVTDQGHAAVPGATVTVTNIDTNAQRVVSSTNEGVYTAPGLAPGRYRINVDLQGFRPLRHEGVALATGETTRIDLEISVGSVQETVTVTANAPMLR